MHEVAILALGCFWQPQDFFARVPGVVHTEVGYTGGTSRNPTYHNLGDHTESIRIEFDSRQLTYEELLEYFWQLHNPTVEEITQYRSVIFYLDERQHQLAQESAARAQEDYQARIVTNIEPAGKFYPAEQYHQQYLAKLRGEM